jgi:DNA-binding CsgD family transcriptional regulator
MIRKLLTRRETEIATFVAAGLSNKQIARKASISEATVKIHLHNAYKKLGVANRSTLTVIVSSGVLPTSDEETRSRVRTSRREALAETAHNHRRPERPPSTRC